LADLKKGLEDDDVDDNWNIYQLDKGGKGEEGEEG